MLAQGIEAEVEAFLAAHRAYGSIPGGMSAKLTRRTRGRAGPPALGAQRARAGAADPDRDRPARVGGDRSCVSTPVQLVGDARARGQERHDRRPQRRHLVQPRLNARHQAARRGAGQDQTQGLRQPADLVCRSRWMRTSRSRAASSACRSGLARLLRRTTLNQPVWARRARPSASPRSLLLRRCFKAPCAALASMHRAGRPASTSPPHSQPDKAPLSSTARARSGARRRSTAASAAGSLRALAAPAHRTRRVDDADLGLLLRDIQAGIARHGHSPQLPQAGG